MNNKVVAIVIIALIGVGVVFVVLPRLGAGFDGSLSVQFFNEGVAVTTPNSLSFMAGSTVIDELRVTIGWSVTGDLGQGSQVAIAGYVELYVEQISLQTNQIYFKKIDTFSFSGASVQTDSRTASFMLADYSELDPDIQQSWTLKLKALLSASQTFEDGSKKSATWPVDGTPKEGIIAVTWTTPPTDAEDAPDLVLNGYWSY